MKQWDRREGEGEAAYRRFVYYLHLGRGRTLETLWAQLEPERSKSPHVPRSWRRTASAFEWDDRANAWDRRSPEAKRMRAAAREERLTRRLLEIGALIEQGLAAIEKARLEDLSKEEARKLLPALRPLIRDLLKVEATHEALLGGQDGDGEPITIEQFLALKALALEEIEQEKAQKALMEPATSTEPVAPAASLLVCLGPDPALHIDLAMARGVRSRTRLPVQVISDCTSDALESHLRRERDLLRPVRWLHLACHGGADGIVFADGLVDGAWLSTYLQGIEVLLIAACKGHVVGEWLAAVPYVITFGDNVAHGDAAIFSKNFWYAIAKGNTPDRAVEEALRHAPEHLDEFLVKHW